MAAAASLFVSSLQAQPAPSLLETRVTATRFVEPAQSLPLGVSVITADEIRASGATNVTEAIARVLGVPARQDLLNGGDATLDLRGFGTTAGSNQVVVVDGIRMSEGDLSAARIAVIPIESVERIEVLRGSGAVLYGEGATGGVIVITTKAREGKQRTTSATLYGAGGSYGLLDLRASGTASFGNGLSLDANVQQRSSDGYRAAADSETRAESVTGQWSNDWLRVGASASHDRLEAGLPGALSAEQFASDPRQAVNRNDRVNLRTDRASVFAQAELGGWQLAFDAGHREKTLRSVNVTPAFTANFDYDVDADVYGLRARNEARFGAVRNIFVVGVDVNEWRREILGLGGSIASQRATGFYLKDDVVLQGGTRFSLGARTEKIRRDNDAPPASALSDKLQAWELGVSQPFAAGWTGYARVGRSFRLANVDEFSFTSPGVDLRPQLSDDVEFGLRWANPSSSVDARVYRSALKDEIGFDPNAVSRFSLFGFNGANVNFDPTRRQGVEIDATHRVNAALGLRANLAYREASFRSGPYAGNDVPLTPHGTVAVRADWTPVANHRLSGGVNWVSSQHPDFANACTMPSYTTADARYAWQFHPRAEFALGVANLFDRKYYTQAFACNASGQATSIYPEPGRQFTASLRLQF